MDESGLEGLVPMQSLLCCIPLMQVRGNWWLLSLPEHVSGAGAAAKLERSGER